MSPTATADLGHDLRMLFAEQAATLDPTPPDLDARCRIEVEPGDRLGGRHPSVIGIASIAAALLLVVVAATLVSRDGRTGLATGGDPTAGPTGGTVPPDPTGTSLVLQVTPGPVDSLDRFRARLDAAFSSPTSVATLGTVSLTGEPTASPAEGGGTSYLAAFTIADGSPGSVVLGDIHTPLDNPVPMLGDTPIADATDIPGIDEGAVTEADSTVGVGLRAGDQFVILTIERVDPNLISADLLPMATALLLGPDVEPIGGRSSSSVVETSPASTDPVSGTLDPRTSLAAMSDEEFERALADMPAEQRPAIQAMRDQYRAGRVRVAGRDGVAGWLSVEGYTAPAATTIDELYPVVDDDGNVVLYWSRSIGGIPKAAVETVPEPTIDELEARYAPRILCDQPAVRSEPSPDQQVVIDRARAQGRCLP